MFNMASYHQLQTKSQIFCARCSCHGLFQKENVSLTICFLTLTLSSIPQWSKAFYRGALPGRLLHTIAPATANEDQKCIRKPDCQLRFRKSCYLCNWKTLKVFCKRELKKSTMTFAQVYFPIHSEPFNKNAWRFLRWRVSEENSRLR